MNFTFPVHYRCCREGKNLMKTLFWPAAGPGVPLPWKPELPTHLLFTCFAFAPAPRGGAGREKEVATQMGPRNKGPVPLPSPLTARRRGDKTPAVMPTDTLVVVVSENGASWSSRSSIFCEEGVSFPSVNSMETNVNLQQHKAPPLPGEARLGRLQSTHLPTTSSRGITPAEGSDGPEPTKFWNFAPTEETNFEE